MKISCIPPKKHYTPSRPKVGFTTIQKSIAGASSHSFSSLSSHILKVPIIHICAVATVTCVNLTNYASVEYPPKKAYPSAPLFSL